MQPIAVLHTKPNGKKYIVFAYFKDYAILYQEENTCTPYIVVYKLDVILNHIEWAQGHYCSTLEKAEEVFFANILLMYGKDEEDETE